MAIELYWDNDAQTVMLCEFDRNWTWDEMYSTLNKIKNITDNAEQIIAAIIDLRKGVSLPGGSIFSPTTFEHAKKMIKMGEGGSGPVVVVGANPLIRTVYTTFRSLDKNGLSNVSFSDSVGEARTLLMAQNYSYEKTPT